jgi:hypothetical protein
LPPHATSADSSRVSCSSARRSWARRRNASITDRAHRQSRLVARRLDGAVGVEIQIRGR